MLGLTGKTVYLVPHGKTHELLYSNSVGSFKTSLRICADLTRVLHLSVCMYFKTWRFFNCTLIDSQAGPVFAVCSFRFVGFQMRRKVQAGFTF